MRAPNRKPMVSVVMPVFNAEPFLAEAIDSTLAQTFEDLELIAVDDESTDTSLEILRNHASQDDRIHVIVRPHTGIAGARNDGIEAASGKYVAALDNDDAMYPQRLERQVAFLEEQDDFVAVGAAAMLVDVDGDPLIERRMPGPADDIERELLDGRNPMMQPGVMFRRDALLEVGGYREAFNFSEDFDLFLRLSERGRLSNLDEVLLRHRQHINRASVSQFEQQQRVAEQALREAYARRGLDRELPRIPTAWHPDTPVGYHTRCASDAWDGGNIDTVRKHARALRRLNPFSLRAMELYSRTLMGRRTYDLVTSIKSWLRPLKAMAGGQHGDQKSGGNGTGTE